MLAVWLRSGGMSNRAQRRSRRRERLRLGPRGTGDQDGPLAEASGLDGPLAELVALYGADTPETLQQVLLIPGRRVETNCHDAVVAFRHAYGEDTTGLLECVLLACTGRQWTNVGRRLLEALVDHEVLDDGHLGVLAVIFLEADTVAVTARGDWLADHYLQVRDGELHPLDPDETYSLRRPIGPQLRRWAARESVHQRDDIGPVLARALALDSRHGAAVILGLLDATDRLDPETASGVLDIGLDWPSPSVRLPALQRLAGAGRHAEALQRAEQDRAARIRHWAVTHRQQPLVDDRDQPTTDATAGPDQPSDEASHAGTSQPTLFG